MTNDLRKLVEEATPGPWEAAERGAYSDFDGQSRVILGDDMRIGVIQGADEESDANARLIAAAPAIAERCIRAEEALLDIARRITHPFDPKPSLEQIAAIARAHLQSQQATEGEG